MSTPEPDTLDELISDCADIPPSLRPGAAAGADLPAPRATTWRVDERAHAQVADLDAY